MIFPLDGRGGEKPFRNGRSSGLGVGTPFAVFVVKLLDLARQVRPLREELARKFRADADDLTLLLNYFAAMDFGTGESSVELGLGELAG